MRKIRLKKITIKDIARECSVSTQTVSRVINNSDNVKDDTREKVLKKIRELEYRPNLYAKNLSRKKNKNILISIRRVKGYAATIWTNSIVNEIFSINNKGDVSIFVEQYYDDEELENSLINKYDMFIDGVVIFYEKKDDPRVKILESLKIPFIIVGKSYSNRHIYISTDDYNTTSKGIEYLLNKKIEKINFITASPSPINDERKKGVIDTFTKYKKDLKNLTINENINKQEEVYKLIKDIYNKKKLPEAFFVSGDEKAITVLKALSDCNIKVPEEISVLGLDDISISKYMKPALTTLALDYSKIADRIYKKLCNMITGNIEKSEEIKCKLIERESVK